jgi:hypothetical protein
VAIGCLLLSVRCHYQLERSDNELSSGIQSLAHILTTSQTDYTAPRSLFIASSRLNFTDAFPRFCLSALDEIEGGWSPSEPTPEGWNTPVELVRAGQFIAAKEAFSRLESGEGILRNRAIQWGLLLDRLINEAGQDTTEQSTAQ